nr:hypothetical protein [Acidimicrobiia bacterium]
MPWERSATAGTPADDTVGSVVVATISEVLGGAAVDLVRSPAGEPPPAEATGPGTASASDDDAVGGRTTLQVRLTGSLAPLAVPVSAPLLAILEAFPVAGLDVLRRFAGAPPALSPSLRRALRDTVVVEALSRLAVGPSGEAAAPAALVAEIVEFLVELSGTRVEAHDLTHGVLVTDALGDTPRLRVGYPEDLRAVKRAPLLFDGQRSVLVVDRHGRARTELQRHQLGRLVPGAAPLDATAVE